MFIKINLLLLISILFISCSNYKVTDPITEEIDDNENISPIPSDVDPKYFIAADYKESEIEFILEEYFKNYNIYIIFLKDTKENIIKNKTIDTINNIIKKSKYIKGVCIDLSRTDLIEIKDNEFKDNKNLIHIKLPDTLETIGEGAFSGCSLLKTINFPASIKEIKIEAFKLCQSLYSADLSKTKLTIINKKTFDNCSSMISIILPETLTKGIDSSAFNECRSLTAIIIPSKVNAIGDAVFYNCKSLKSIKLNASIKEIGDMVFSGCSVLSDIEYLGRKPSDITTVGKDIFKDSLSSKTLYLPNVSKDDGSWNNFLGYDWKKNVKIIFGKSMPK